MKSHCLRLLSGLGLLASLCLSSSTAEGVLVSIKSTGMAATGISYPQDALAGAYNPAGAAEIGDRFDLGITWGHDQGKAHVHGNTVGGILQNPLVNGHFNAMRYKNVFSPDFGINKNFCFGCWNMSVGFVAYNRNFQKTSYKDPFVLIGTTRLGLEYVHETFSPVVAFKFDKHDLGLSVNYMVQRLKVDGLQNFASPAFSSSPSRVTNKGYNYSHGVGFTVGWRWQATDTIAVGLTYQPETVMSRFNKYKGFLAQKGKLNIPRKIGAGISMKVLPSVTVAFDIEHIQWKCIRPLHNPLLPNLFRSELGRRNGAGFGWHDQLYLRVGADYRLNDCWTVRAGYRHANTPVRHSQTAVNLLSQDTIEDFVTVGATWTYDCLTEISGFFAYGFGHQVKGEDSIPTFLGAGEVNLHEYSKYALGISLGRKF